MPTTFATRPIHPVYRRDGYTFKAYPLADAADFEQGAPVLLDNGEFDETGVDPALIAGFALASTDDYAWKEDTFGSVVPSVPVAMADQEFRGTLSNSDAGWAQAWDPDFVGNEFGITATAEDIWVVDAFKDAGVTRVRITGVDDEVEADDINVPVRFVVLAANRQVIS